MVIGDSVVDNPILFAGYFYDNETGLYHVRHRMYSPTLQRWLQRDPLHHDPLRTVTGFNAYEYAQSTPAASLDPYGLVPLTCEWAGVRRWADKKWYLTLVWASDILGGTLETGHWGLGFPTGLFLRRYRDLYKCCDRKDRVVVLWGDLLIAWGTSALTGAADMVMAQDVGSLSIQLPYGQSISIGVGWIMPGETVNWRKLAKKKPEKTQWAPAGLGVPRGFRLVKHIKCCPPGGGIWPGTPPFPRTPRPPRSWLKPTIIYAPSLQQPGGYQ